MDKNGVRHIQACQLWWRVGSKFNGIWSGMARDPFVDDAGPALASLWGAGVHTRCAA